MVDGTIYQVDNTGDVIRTGPVAPGRTFFAGFNILNESSEPVTLSGFAPDFVFTMHPNRQADFPIDHCEQFFETRTFDSREYTQTYPQVIAPGETITIYDNVTYHYIRGPVSNECQQGSMYFGGPIFGEIDPDDPPTPPTPPEEAQDPETPSESLPPQAPTPPARVDTGR